MEKPVYHQKSPKASVYVFNICTYVVPFIWMTLRLMGCNAFDDPLYMIPTLQQWPVLLYLVVGFGSVMYCLFFNIAKLRTYDGTEESYLELRKNFSMLAVVNLFAPLTMGFLFPLVLYFSASLIHIPSNLFNMILSGSSSSILFSVMFYSLWITRLEDWVSFLPLREDDVHVGMTQRIIMVMFLSVYSCYAASWVTVANSEEIRNLTGQAYVLAFISKGKTTTIVTGIIALLDMRILVGDFVKRVKRINGFTQELAAGNYTVEKIDSHGRDELGLVLNNINRFYSQTQSLLSGVSHNVTDTVQLGKEVTRDMEIAATNVAQIISNIDDVKNRVLQQNSIVHNANQATDEIVENIKTLNESIESQSSGVEESSAAIRQMVGNIQNITEVLDRNLMVVSELQKQAESGQEKIASAVASSAVILESSKSVFEASRMIQSIATQTNLLAMNAAIEAAHAGEAGSGFAVVAGEIRKLAELSSSQGKQIGQSLKELNAIIQQVGNDNNAVQAQFSVIYDMTRQVAEQELSVKNNMAEQAEGSREILQAIQSINDSTVVVRNGAHNVIEQGKLVEDEMTILESSSSDIANAMTEMAAGTSQILESVQNVNKNSDRNRETLSSLQQEMAKFTLS